MLFYYRRESYKLLENKGHSKRAVPGTRNLIPGIDVCVWFLHTFFRERGWKLQTQAALVELS